MRALVVLTLFAAPLAFGSVHRLPLLVVCAVGAAAGIWSMRGSSGKTPPPGARAFGVVVAVTLAQLLPLPRALVEVVSPGSPGTGRWTAVGIDPKTSLIALAVLTCWALLYAAVQRDFDGEWRARLKNAVVAAAAVASVVALVQSAASTTTIYGLWRPRYDWAVYGPFVNRNHFGGYVLLGFFLAADHVFEALHAARRQWDKRRTRKWLALLDAETLRVFSHLGILAVVGVALLDSASRGAILAGLLAALLYVSARFRSRAVRVTTLAAALAVLGTIAVSPTLRAQASTSRGEVLADALRLVPRFPVLGSGLETFAPAYHPIKKVWKNDFVHHAHNEYLQAWIELGPAGLVALLIVVLGALRGAWRRGPEAAGVTAALAAVALHNLVDFNWHIPATAVTWAALAGLALQPGSRDLYSRLAEPGDALAVRVADGGPRPEPPRVRPEAG